MKELLANARQGSVALAATSTEEKNRGLAAVSARLRSRIDDILVQNAKDVEHAEASDLEASFVDRLRLTPERIEAIAAAVDEIIDLEDPVGQITESWERPNGLTVQKKRIPLGLIAIIYEARPNVTVDAAALCFKSGNGVVLKGGSFAINSNRILHRCFVDALEESGLINVAPAIAFIDSTDRSIVKEMLAFDQYIDLVIPRGGKPLVKFVNEHARMPVLKHDEGVCHVVVDGSADADMVDAIVMNSKTHRTSVCNSAESLLFLENATGHIERVLMKLSAAGVRLHLDQTAGNYAGEISWVEATDESHETEFLAMEMSVAVVPDVAAAAEHIERYGSRHTEAIITADPAVAESFVNAVNSSCVLVNASTRFADGNQLGLGAEIGISTTRMHAYGPMGLKELTTTKFVVHGNGQIRN